MDKDILKDLSQEEREQGMAVEAFAIKSTIEQWVEEGRASTQEAIDRMINQDRVEETTLDDERGYAVNGVRLRMTEAGLMELVDRVLSAPQIRRQKAQRANEAKAMAIKAKKNKAKKRQAKKQRQQRKRK